MANVGGLDRILRFVIGFFLLVAVFVPPLAGFLQVGVHGNSR